ncbi:MAG: two-component sensor histidine kinase, partial [Ruminococcus sp.]|nr:two-component sensor histidine kinase [Ruminococcus sp.]
MKRLSLKMKLTILYTALMTTVVCGVLAILLSINNHEILTSVQSRLEEKVAETTEDIEYRNGALEFDSDILELEHGIYIS